MSWRRLAGPIGLAVFIVLLGLLYALLQNQQTGARLDPRSAERDGARALAVLLENRGVEVRRTERVADALAAADEDSTLLVTVPDALLKSRLARVAKSRARHLVLLGPDEPVLERLAPGVYRQSETYGEEREPGCRLRAAVRAGRIETRGPLYRAPKGQNCYGDGSQSALVRATSGTRTVDVLGTVNALTNEELGDQGNAALAMNLLGSERRLVWYIPSTQDVPEDDRQGLFSLLPDGVRAALGMGVVAIVLLAIAAARRLGPVVPENLPVAVSASETVRGQARLYQRMRARDQASRALTAAVRTRLAGRLGLPADAPDESLVAAIAARTGRPAAEVADLLRRTPADDDALTTLADELDRLEEEVRRS